MSTLFNRPVTASPTGSGPVQVPLAMVADVKIVEGPAMIKSENGMLRNYVQLNVRDRDIVGFVEEAQLDWCGFFAYSAEEGTYAAGLDGAVPRGLMGERLAELRERGELRDDIGDRELVVFANLRVIRRILEGERQDGNIVDGPRFDERLACAGRNEIEIGIKLIVAGIRAGPLRIDMPNMRRNRLQNIDDPSESIGAIKQAGWTFQDLHPVNSILIDLQTMFVAPLVAFLPHAIIKRNHMIIT